MIAAGGVRAGKSDEAGAWTAAEKAEGLEGETWKARPLTRGQ
jgi:hypothetical protein